MIKRLWFLFWGTPDRVITTISFFSGMAGLGLSIITYRYPTPPPDYIISRDDAVVATFLLIIAAIAIKYYKKDKMVENFREALHSQWESNHHLIHNFRDHFFWDIRNEIAQNANMNEEQIGEMQRAHLEDVCRTILQDTRDEFLTYFRSRGLQVENDLSLTVKTKITADEAQGILDSIKGSSAHTLNKSASYIVTAYRDPITWGTKPERTEIMQIIYEINRENTTFDEIINQGKNYYLSNNLKLEFEEGRYHNQNPNWQNNYNSVLAVPIRYKRQGDTRATVTYGAISVDARNPNKYDLFNSKYTFHLLAASADILALMFGHFDLIQLTIGARKQ